MSFFERLTEARKRKAALQAVQRRSGSATKGTMERLSLSEKGISAGESSMSRRVYPEVPSMAQLEREAAVWYKQGGKGLIERYVTALSDREGYNKRQRIGHSNQTRKIDPQDVARAFGIRRTP